MNSLVSFVYRGKLIESTHQAICVVKDNFNKIIFSTNNENNLIYPRSAIKIFQALPFVMSNAPKKLNLNNKNIAIACSSHKGEPLHIKVLENWLKKIGIQPNQLMCGVHNPINEKSSNDLLLSGKTPTQLHNNCAGKHLAMISGCIANELNINKYNDFKHPYQKLIRTILETFMETKIKKNCIGIDGCSVPQYAFPLNNIASSMINLIRKKEVNHEYSQAINILVNSINKYPLLIGGQNCFDSQVIKITKGRIFCKGGAEGVLLFADYLKKIGGVIKILDGNNRAISSVAMKIFSKLKILSSVEEKKLSHWSTVILFNHAKRNIGKIVTKLK